MKQWMKNIFLIFLSLTLIVSTSGINIFIHHCTCTDNTSISLVEEHHSSCCSHDHDQQRLVTSACCTEDISDSRTICSAHTNCCELTHKFVKIKDNYLISSVEISFTFIASCFEVLFDIENIFSKTELANIFQYLNTLPPKIAGKQLLFFLQHLKLDIPDIS
jgi:hypothetical protein